VRTLEDPGSTTDSLQLQGNLLAFPGPQPAQAYADRLRIQGRDVGDPVHESSLRRWTVVVRSPLPDGERFAIVGPDVAAAMALGGWHLGACWPPAVTSRGPVS
jgi:hypothetical protein